MLGWRLVALEMVREATGARRSSLLIDEPRVVRAVDPIVNTAGENADESGIVFREVVGQSRDGA